MSKYNLLNQEICFPEDSTTAHTIEESIYAIYGTKSATAFYDSKPLRELKKLFGALLSGCCINQPKFSSLHDLQEFALDHGYCVTVLSNGKLEISDSVESEIRFD